MRHGVTGDNSSLLTGHWVVPKLLVPHCLRLAEGLPDTWMLEFYAHTCHGSSLLATKPQHFSETPGFCEVRTTTVIIWGKPPPPGQLWRRASHSTRSSPRQGSCQGKHREGALEALAGSCLVWRSTEPAELAPKTWYPDSPVTRTGI